MPAHRITDPHAIPVAGTDAHLPPLLGAHLAVPALRQRLAAAHLLQPEIVGDGERLAAGSAATAASVLVPLVQRGDGLHVLLTQRTAHLRDHAGQISFPGGRAEPEDDSAAATALREAQEEVGLTSQWVEVIGQLPVYTTITRYVVTPVVALVHPDAPLALDSFEVAEAFEVPLAYLMNPANHQRHVFALNGVQRQFLSMPWRRHLGADGTGGPRDYFIWGATAAMLRNLYGVLARDGGSPIISAR
jgi:8-oxo-dGTP pyrophosphatase MutT (NUDIX family)